MNSGVVLHPKAADSLKRLPTSARTRVVESLSDPGRRLAENSRIVPSRFRRLMVGDCTVIDQVDEKTGRITVLYIGRASSVPDDFSKLV